MSTPEPMPSAPAKGGHGSRYLFLFLVGLVVGVVGAVMALRALNARKDHFPESVMHVQQWHMGQLKGSLEQNRCGPTDTLPHVQSLRSLANQPVPARRMRANLIPCACRWQRSTHAGCAE